MLKIELSLGVFPSPAQAKAVSPAHFDESITRIEGCDGLVYATFLGHEGHISRHMSKRWRMRRTPIAHIVQKQFGGLLAAVQLPGTKQELLTWPNGKLSQPFIPFFFNGGRI